MSTSPCQVRSRSTAAATCDRVGDGSAASRTGRGLSPRRWTPVPAPAKQRRWRAGSARPEPVPCTAPDGLAHHIAASCSLIAAGQPHLSHRRVLAGGGVRVQRGAGRPRRPLHRPRRPRAARRPAQRRRDQHRGQGAPRPLRRRVLDPIDLAAWPKQARRPVALGPPHGWPAVTVTGSADVTG